jgi:predicted DNA binding CopG/RHH family protein
MNLMSKKAARMPKFKTESEEADWWASPAGRAYVKQKSAKARTQGTQAAGSRAVAMLNQKRSVQIAIRLPETDLAQARKIANHKGIGYQTLIKMLVREGLVREGWRGRNWLDLVVCRGRRWVLRHWVTSRNPLACGQWRSYTAILTIPSAPRVDTQPTYQ